MLDGLMLLFRSGRGFLKGSRWQGSFPLTPGSVARWKVASPGETSSRARRLFSQFPRSWAKPRMGPGGVLGWLVEEISPRSTGNTRAFTGRGSLLLDAPDAWLLVAPCSHRRKLELKPYGTMDSGKRKGGQPECVANLRTALFDPGRSWAPGRMGPYGR